MTIKRNPQNVQEPCVFAISFLLPLFRFSSTPRSGSLFPTLPKFYCCMPTPLAPLSSMKTSLADLSSMGMSLRSWQWHIQRQNQALQTKTRVRQGRTNLLKKHWGSKPTCTAPTQPQHQISNDRCICDSFAHWAVTLPLGPS